MKKYVIGFLFLLVLAFGFSDTVIPIYVEVTLTKVAGSSDLYVLYGTKFCEGSCKYYTLPTLWVSTPQRGNLGFTRFRPNLLFFDMNAIATKQGWNTGNLEESFANYIWQTIMGQNSSLSGGYGFISVGNNNWGNLVDGFIYCVHGGNSLQKSLSLQNTWQICWLNADYNLTSVFFLPNFCECDESGCSCQEDATYYFVLGKKNNNGNAISFKVFSYTNYNSTNHIISGGVWKNGVSYYLLSSSYWDQQYFPLKVGYPTVNFNHSPSSPYRGIIISATRYGIPINITIEYNSS